MSAFQGLPRAGRVPAPAGRCNGRSRQQAGATGIKPIAFRTEAAMVTAPHPESNMKAEQDLLQLHRGAGVDTVIGDMTERWL
ncbi:MAG: hypothetical protein VXY93_17490 [Pseudomonadota bacterium]|nr:hypothetical protein [Pseudomonadota bacterium]